MNNQPETKIIYIVEVNTDLTEGRGHQVPIAFCETQATAVRLAKGKGVQGSNGQVHEFPAIKHRGAWCAPFQLTRATDKDKQEQERIDLRAAAIARFKASGLSDDDLKLIQGAP